MKAFNIQIIETTIILSSYIILYFVFKTVINNFLKIKPDWKGAGEKWQLELFSYLLQ